MATTIIENNNNNFIEDLKIKQLNKSSNQIEEKDDDFSHKQDGN